ncbi:MAG: P63C domain-containing protein [Clostridium sp.]|nr:P63C domain-containing protein [Clostridium sp.]MDU7082925.1 P63C domain-containing protein [Clostridium sp.]
MSEIIVSDVNIEELFECIHEGSIVFGPDNEIPCAVIQKGKEVIRVISNKGMFKSFKRTQHGRVSVDGLPSVVGGHNIAQYISEEDMPKLEKIFYKDGNKVKTGYNAEAITIVCAAYLEAERNGVVRPQQKTALNQAKIILLTLSRIGITALIDEATGYQYSREFDALQKLLELYTVEQPLLSLQKRFPRTYYKELYRLYGWKFDPNNTKRPQYVGKFTYDYIYKLLPEPVVEQIRVYNPKVENKNYRKNKYYQYLTLDTGIPELDKIISKIVGIMSVSDDIEQFKMFYTKAFNEEIELRNSRNKEVSTSEQINFLE